MIGKVFSDIEEEDGHGNPFGGELMGEGIFLQPPRFPGEPLDPVAVDGLLKMAAAGAKASLNGTSGCPWSGVGRGKEVKDLEWKNGKTPALFKYLIDPFPAFQFFGFRPGISLKRRHIYIKK